MSGNAYIRALDAPIPQSAKADSRQVQNNAGGFTFTIDDKARLERLLILGTDGGTYYVDEKKLTQENIDFVKALIAQDEQLVIDTVREISVSGRAYRNSTAIFVTALLFKFGTLKPSALVRDVCRIGTHIFEFAQYVELLGGWNRSNRRAVSEWFTTKPVDKLAYDAVKYRQRDGWTHRDLARLAHPTGLDLHVGRFITGRPAPEHGEEIPVIAGFKEMQKASTEADVLSILSTYSMLPWETIPTEQLKSAAVWKKLFHNNALNGQALLRNITRLARIGAFNDMVFAREYANKLTDEEMIKRTKLHPFQYLLALTTHERGQINSKVDAKLWRYAVTPNKDWQTNSIIVSALNEGFYKAFEYVEPANKRTMIALDVSGSMSSSMAGIGLRACEITAAMSMTIARTESWYQIMGFATDYIDLGISASMDLNTVLKKVVMSNFGGTDCSLPMIDAVNRHIEVDTFIVMTDNETWAGNVHPHTALKNYRRKMGIDAKLIVVSTTPTYFSIADPTDRGMIDVCGADSNLPKLISEFSAGRI